MENAFCRHDILLLLNDTIQYTFPFQNVKFITIDAVLQTERVVADYAPPPTEVGGYLKYHPMDGAKKAKSKDITNHRSRRSGTLLYLIHKP